MVNQSTLTANKGARKSTKRLGRGNGSGRGTFSGRGCKGQKARSGKKIHTLFEGGQSPLHLRLPKMRGFKRTLKQPHVALNLDDLEKMATLGELTHDALVAAKIINKSETVKILGRGTLKASVTVHAAAASESAIKAIEKAGGKVILPVKVEKVAKKAKPETKKKAQDEQDSE